MPKQMLTTRQTVGLAFLLSVFSLAGLQYQLTGFQYQAEKEIAILRGQRLKAEEGTRTAEEALLKVNEEITILKEQRLTEAKAAEEARLKVEEGTRTAESMSSARIEHHHVHSLRKEQHEERELPGNKVFVVGPWVSKEIVGHNSKYLPNDFEIHVFNHSSMTRSVRLIDQELREKAGLVGAWESYKLLRPWAFRADLWRYMILWSEGGVYLDSKMKMMAPLTSWATLEKNETLSCCHDMNGRWKSARRNNAVPILWNGAMSARRGSPILLQAIKLIIQNVESRSYVIKGERNLVGSSHADLSVTGPILLGYAATSENIEKGSLRVDCGHHGHGNHMYLEPYNLAAGERGLVLEGDRAEHQKVRSSGNTRTYGDLYKLHSIYCDENGQKEPCDIEKLLGEGEKKKNSAY